MSPLCFQPYEGNTNNNQLSKYQVKGILQQQQKPHTQLIQLTATH